MSITLIDGIGYSSRTKAAFVVPTGGNADGKAFSVPATKNTTSIKPWAEWGNNNDLPTQLAADIESCGVLSAALDAKARIAVGRGLLPFLLVGVDGEGKEQLEYVDDTETHDWLELNDSFDYSIDSIFDTCSYGLSATQLLLSRNRKKINRIMRTDAVTVRLKKKDNNGFINSIYINNCWDLSTTWPSDYVKEVPLLEESAEGLDLIERSSGYEFAVINRQLRNGRGYYPMPLWRSAKGWVDHAKAIPAIKNAMTKNEITVKYLVTISSSYWKRIHTKWDTYTAEKKQEIMNAKLEEIDKYLSGQENQYKTIFTTSYVDPITKQEIPDIKIEVLDDKIKDGKLLTDSAAANSEILFALCVNPALVRAGQPGGAYSQNAGGSNIRESYLTQIMLLERERRANTKIFNIVKNYNGWSKRLEVERTTVPVTAAVSPMAPTKVKPRLVFRYPANVLTTLDTGKSTKGEVV